MGVEYDPNTRSQIRSLTHELLVDLKRRAAQAGDEIPGEVLPLTDQILHVAERSTRPFDDIDAFFNKAVASGHITSAEDTVLSMASALSDIAENAITHPGQTMSAEFLSDTVGSPDIGLVYTLTGVTPATELVSINHLRTDQPSGHASALERRAPGLLSSMFTVVVPHRTPGGLILEERITHYTQGRSPDLIGLSFVLPQEGAGPRPRRGLPPPSTHAA